MMWTRIERVEDAPQEGLLHKVKHHYCNLSNYIWLITRDDETPIMVAGLYRPMTSREDFIWFIPYAALRPLDWRGIVKLVARLKAGTSALVAAVDPDSPAAIRVVEHLGFTLAHDGAERIYRWRS